MKRPSDAALSCLIFALFAVGWIATAVAMHQIGSGP